MDNIKFKVPDSWHEELGGDGGTVIRAFTSLPLVECFENNLCDRFDVQESTIVESMDEEFKKIVKLSFNDEYKKISKLKINETLEECDSMDKTMCETYTRNDNVKIGGFDSLHYSIYRSPHYGPAGISEYYLLKYNDDTQYYFYSTNSELLNSLIKTVIFIN